MPKEYGATGVNHVYRGMSILRIFAVPSLPAPGSGGR